MIGRWIFWRIRFKDLCKSDDEKLAWIGNRRFGSMIYTGQETESQSLEKRSGMGETMVKYLHDKRERNGATGWFLEETSDCSPTMKKLEQGFLCSQD